MQSRVQLFAVVASGTFVLQAAGTAAQIQAPIPRQAQVPRMAPAAINLNASGISVQLTPRVSLGPSMPGHTPISLGAPTNLQIQAVTPMLINAGAGKLQVSGTVQFPASDQQAAAINACAVSSCGADLTVTYATPQGAVTYQLLLVSFTQVDLSTGGIRASFTSPDLKWQLTGPGSVPTGAGAPPNVPAGASVAFVPAPTGTRAAPLSLGMAAGFQLQDVPTGGGPGSSTPRYGTGTIQFPAGPQPMQLNCLYSCMTTLIVTNATPQGTTVYTLSGVNVNAITIGAATTFSFTYLQIRWATFAPGAAQPTQSAGWDYATSHALP